MPPADDPTPPVVPPAVAPPLPPPSDPWPDRCRRLWQNPNLAEQARVIRSELANVAGRRLSKDDWKYHLCVEVTAQWQVIPCGLSLPLGRLIMFQGRTLTANCNKHKWPSTGRTAKGCTAWKEVGSAALWHIEGQLIRWLIMGAIEDCASDHHNRIKDLWE